MRSEIDGNSCHLLLLSVVESYLGFSPKLILIVHDCKGLFIFNVASFSGLILKNQQVVMVMLFLAGPTHAECGMPHWKH